MHTSEMIATSLYTSDVANESIRRIVGHYEECNSQGQTYTCQQLVCFRPQYQKGMHTT
jgi:hypothetical protein